MSIDSALRSSFVASTAAIVVLTAAAPTAVAQQLQGEAVTLVAKVTNATTNTSRIAALVSGADKRPAPGKTVTVVRVNANDPPLFAGVAMSDAEGVASFPNLGYVGTDTKPFLVQFVSGSTKSDPVVLQLYGHPVDKIEGSPALAGNTLAPYVRGAKTDPITVKVTVLGFPAARQLVRVWAHTDDQKTPQYVIDTLTNDDGIATLNNVNPAVGCSTSSCAKQTITIEAGVASMTLYATPSSGALKTLTILGGGSASSSNSGGGSGNGGTAPSGNGGGGSGGASGAAPILTIRAGGRIQTPLALSVKQDGKPAQDEVVSLFTPDGHIIVQGVSDAKGMVRLSGGRSVMLPARDTVLHISIADTTADVKVHVIAGYQSRAYSVQEPPPDVNANAPFTTAPSIKVVDSAGNPVRGSVRLRLCWFGLAQPKEVILRTDCRPAPASQLMPPLVVPTDTVGNVTFDKAGILGDAGTFRIEYLSVGVGEAPDSVVLLRSAPFRYLFNKSFVAISAIKTISGAAPSSEFFDLRFRFKYGEHFSTMINGDIPLSSFTDTSKFASQGKMTEALGLVNWDVCLLGHRLGRHDCDDAPLRRPFVGFEAKIFNSIPYYGVQVGSVELGSSPFQGSMFTIGLAKPLWYSALDTAYSSDGAMVAARTNIFIDFFVRSSQIEFFKLLNIRGSLLFAHGDKPGVVMVQVPGSTGTSMTTTTTSGSGGTTTSVTQPTTMLSVFRSGFKARIAIAVPIVIFPY